MNHILYNISIKQKRSKQEQKEGKQMLIECPANTRLQDYLLQNDIHILTACGGRGNCAKCVVRIIRTRHSKYNGSNMVLRRAASCRLSVRLPCICKRTAYSRNSQLTAQNSSVFSRFNLYDKY